MIFGFVRFFNEVDGSGNALLMSMIEWKIECNGILKSRDLVEAGVPRYPVVTVTGKISQKSSSVASDSVLDVYREARHAVKAKFCQDGYWNVLKVSKCSMARQIKLGVVMKQNFKIFFV